MTVDISVCLTLCVAVTLIIKLLASAKTDLHLGMASRKVDFKRHDRIALLLDVALEL